MLYCRRWLERSLSRAPIKYDAPATRSRHSTYSAAHKAPPPYIYPENRKPCPAAYADHTLTRDHTYFQTWQLPRGLPSPPRNNDNHDDVTIETPGNGYDTGYYTDHIYESPTFSHLDVAPDCNNPMVSSAKYYELDPENEPFYPQDTSNDSRNVENRGKRTHGTSGNAQRCSFPGMPSASQQRMATQGSYTS